MHPGISLRKFFILQKLAPRSFNQTIEKLAPKSYFGAILQIKIIDYLLCDKYGTDMCIVFWVYTSFSWLGDRYVGILIQNITI